MPAVTPPAKCVPNSARDRLVDAALELFATRGYQAIGLRDLAGHLGLHAGSLYNHIENKQCLLFELIEAALSDLLADTKRRMRGANSNRERLRRFINAFVSFSLAEKNRLLLVTREFVNLTEDQQKEINQLKCSYASLLNTIVSTERSEQDRTSECTGVITDALIGMFYGHSQWRTPEIPVSELTDTLTSFAIGIITAGKNQDRHSSDRKL
ncbi:AcrR family transcriptional regulator [Pseudomonas sp. JUb42]|jgi:AcrR family transcriptional regulator|uniref:TetR/AcrR family transcriptional regulator n=1 Tax=Pseudomonas sp. JUb42 TaxID=2940611 RepID=UPI0021679C1E|nr:TetR/AcrR family transcriptional regulator [Pseudomonas sp. JUb42]MCS3470094.1 AcrR family transcriptional regulator [Pseudomonas sp. JUb42]